LLDEEPGTDISDFFPNVLMEHKSGIMTLLSSHHPSDSKYITHVEQFVQIAKKLSTQSPFIILDLGPSLTPINSEILPLCDKILICLEPSPANITQTRILIQDLINSGVSQGRFIAVLINRQRSGVQLSWEQAENLLERKIDQIFTPVPELAYQAAAKNIPIIQRPEESMTADQFRDLAKLILN
jgi:cellulose biosynthesis protein BcsQ